MPPRWSPEPWTCLGSIIYKGPALYEQILAVVNGRTPEETDANGRLITAAPEAARLLALLYPGVPVTLREQMHAWFSKVGVTLEVLGSSGPPHAEK